MDPAYGAEYAALYEHHWWWRAREAYLLGLLRKYVGPSRDGEVLDFGCGDGLFLDALREFGVPCGIETDEALLDPRGRWRPHIDVRPLEPDPGEHSRFRLIVALDVLEHIDEPEPVVVELARRLQAGGWFIATVPAFMSLWTTHDDLNRHHRRYRRHELEDLARQADLDIVRSRYFFSWVAVPKWLLARAERIFPRSPRPPRVPPTPVNSAAYALSRLEQLLLARVPAPFGSSALVIARRR